MSDYGLTRTMKVREVGGTTVVTIPKDIRRAWGLKVGSRVQVKLRFVLEGDTYRPTDVTLRKWQER